MKYIKRSLERKFLEMNKVFKAIMITGARQVGKTTMLEHLARNQKRTIVSLDDDQARELANNDPKLFFDFYKTPILIDEIQKAPALMNEIKIICDSSEDNGQFWLTGSSSKKLVKQAGDSLAGRICILNLYSLSFKERNSKTGFEDMVFDANLVQDRISELPKTDTLKVFNYLWQGGMPGAINLNQEQRFEFYNSYLNTYLIKDAVEDNGVINVMAFKKFIRACAALNSQLLNYSKLAEIAEVSIPTIKDWVSILVSMGIIFLVEPFSNNDIKRIVKTPKMYFCDTGFCSFLSRWTSEEILMYGAANGHYFENFVACELIRNLAYSKNKMNLTYLRNTNKQEIDFIIEEGKKIHPFEVKLSSSPSKRDISSFRLLNKSNYDVGFGGVICMSKKLFPLDENNYVIPVTSI